MPKYVEYERREVTSQVVVCEEEDRFYVLKEGQRVELDKSHPEDWGAIMIAAAAQNVLSGYDEMVAEKKRQQLEQQRAMISMVKDFTFER
jgi:hypothetical protein